MRARPVRGPRPAPERGREVRLPHFCFAQREQNTSADAGREGGRCLPAVQGDALDHRARGQVFGQGIGRLIADVPIEAALALAGGDEVPERHARGLELGDARGVGLARIEAENAPEDWPEMIARMAVVFAALEGGRRWEGTEYDDAGTLGADARETSKLQRIASRKTAMPSWSPVVSATSSGKSLRRSR